MISLKSIENSIIVYVRRILCNVKKLICGKDIDKLSRIPKNAYCRQIKHIKAVWNSEKYEDFGIERILRLFLVSIQFIFPGMFIRYISGLKNVFIRKICVEVYVIIKIALYILLLFYFDSRNWYCWICIYLIAETFIYLLGLIFLNTEYRAPVSYKRNVLLVLINFIEITLGFATIYYSTLRNSMCGLETPMDAIYYSFISVTTIGYGDIRPITNLAKFTCIVQSFISLLFTVFIIGRFISDFDKVGYINNEQNKENN